jgi:hypothetical protein
MRIKLIVLSSICFLLLTGNVYSVDLAYKFSGTIDYREGNSHGGFFNVGTPVTGWYCFNTNSPDFNPNTKLIQTYSIGNPYGFKIVINGITFSTDNASMLFSNDNSGEDRYQVNATGLPLTPSGSFSGSENMNNISGTLMLVDNSQRYFPGSEVFVPMTTPSLSQFDYTKIRFSADISSTWDLYFTAQITELTAIPEPGTILLLGLGAALLRRKK